MKTRAFLRRSMLALLFLCCVATVNAQTFSDVMASADWNVFFPHRFNPDDRTGAGTLPTTAAKDFYSYSNFATAVSRMANIKIISERRCGTNAYRLTRVDKTTGASIVIRTDADFNISTNMIITETIDYATFAGDGDLTVRKRELMAFLANISQETTGGWPTAPGGQYAWGLYFREEVGYEGTTNIGYRDETNTTYPPAPGKSYHGRGPIQLSYNYNYGQASEFIFGDKNVLLANPEKVIQDGVIAFETGIWFWMAQQYPKPSCHDVMIPGKFTPTAEQLAIGLKPGFGATVNVINGGVECGGTTENTKVLSRIGHYQRYTTLKQVSLELDGGNNSANCGCANMGRFSIDAAECSKVTSLRFSSPANGILNVTSLSPVTLTVAKNDPRNEISQVYITINGQTTAGTSAQFTPTAYKSYTARAAGARTGKDSVVSTITFAVYNTATMEGCSYLPVWDASKIYETAGTIVLYNSVVYRNQWWAGAADIPGSNTTWAVVGTCTGNGGNGGGNGESCGTVAGWAIGSIYVSGNQAAYNGKIYKARWWTQGERPDLNSADGQVWQFISNCPSSAARIGVNTAIAGNATEKVIVYPNPVAGSTLQLTVNANTQEKLLISLLDVKTGQPVLQKVYTPGSKSAQKIQLDISHVPNGVWILKVSTERAEQIGTTKVVRIQ
ncbi:Por secretion system C-terminal sorting domain-containing protein [Chitinophaga sp. CF118]|uniref:glycoside hydrolase family 19 protein n=1 Tax=Chitinophaga sp. CF118 TaxID=1884367 RepID=UPI0008F1A86F|nr:glycoside hydrolase family 19 protein [Chitinophaga sp. CF118]SFD55855.1 Por secretion system C-terminal sorting domain-containing protein [Chitinophaga sp. CF118]